MLARIRPAVTAAGLLAGPAVGAGGVCLCEAQTQSGKADDKSNKSKSRTGYAKAALSAGAISAGVSCVFMTNACVDGIQTICSFRLLNTRHRRMKALLSTMHCSNIPFTEHRPQQASHLVPLFSASRKQCKSFASTLSSSTGCRYLRGVQEWPTLIRSSLLARAGRLRRFKS